MLHQQLHEIKHIFVFDSMLLYLHIALNKHIWLHYVVVNSYLSFCQNLVQKKRKKKPGQQIRKAFTSLHWHENIIFQKWLPLLLISFWRRMFGKLYTFTSFINQQDSPAHFLAILNMLAALTNISAASSTLVELPL